MGEGIYPPILPFSRSPVELQARNGGEGVLAAEPLTLQETCETAGTGLRRLRFSPQSRELSRRG